MKSIVRLHFLGTVQVEREGEPVKGFGSRKALALLGYLAVQGQPVPRARLADLFWENRSATRGRANLSWTQRRVSKLLPGCLKADRHTVEFQRGEGYWLDVDAFAELEAQGEAGALAEAAGLYRGEFLEGLCLAGCPEFEIWLAGERERWRSRVACALEELVACHGERGEYEEGLRFGRRLLELEPWQEEAHQEVMRLLAWTGRRGAALAQYKACCQALAEELGVKPAAETVRLYERIRDGEVEAPVVAPPRLAGVRMRPPSFLDEEAGYDLERAVFVARERELGRLGGYLEAALAGRGQVVFVTGDAGQGKTALVQEFARRAQADHPELVVADGNGNAHTGVGDPYLPFREVLGLLTGDVKARWAAGAIARERGRRLWHLLPIAVQALVKEGPDLVDTFVAGGALVGRARAFAPGGAEWLDRLEELLERKAAMGGAPGPQQSNLFEQYRRAVRELAGEKPLLLILDDLQWADVGSIDLLFHLGREVEGGKVLIVGAYRPAEVALGRDGKRHPLESVVNELKRQSGEIEVELREEGRQFVAAFLDTEPNRLGETFRETLYRQTEGHPLFTVELLRGMQERGDLVQDDEGRWVEGEELDWETLPPRVEAVIAERVGRLAEPLQRLLRVASVEGEAFSAEVVARVEGADEHEVVDHLSGELDKQCRLVRAQGIERVGPGRLSRYRFRHILFQRYLYSNLDAVERAHLHEAVGGALEKLYGEGTEELMTAAPQLAWHYQEAGIVGKAVEYLGRAGERAVRMSANEEAIAHYTQALALLATLPDTGGKERRLERAQQELMLQLGLGVPLLAAKGFGFPELGRVYNRAWELCQQMGGSAAAPACDVAIGKLLRHARRTPYGAGDQRAAPWSSRAIRRPPTRAIRLLSPGMEQPLSRRVDPGPGAPGAGARLLRPGAASRPPLSLRGGRRRIECSVSFLGAVAARLSRPIAAAQSGGRRPGGGAGASDLHGHRQGSCCRMRDDAPGCCGGPGVGRDVHYRLERAWPPVLVGVGGIHPRLGVGRAGPDRRGHGSDAPERGRHECHGSPGGASSAAGLPSRGARQG
jgi:DNA-binding SARP family transcriptional activator